MKIICCFRFNLYFCSDYASLIGLGGSKSYWNPEAENTGLPPFGGTGRGLCQREKTFSDVTVCELKLRNFDNSYSGNATKRLRG